MRGSCGRGSAQRRWRLLRPTERRSAQASCTATHAARTRREAGPGRRQRRAARFLALARRAAARRGGLRPAQAVANHALCGVGAIDSTTAITAHPLHNYVDWDAALAADAGVAVEQLPRVVPGFTTGRGTPERGAGRWRHHRRVRRAALLRRRRDGRRARAVRYDLITWGTIDDERAAPGFGRFPTRPRAN